MALGLTPQQIIDKGTHPQLVIADDWERVQLKHIATVQNGFAFSSKLFNHNEGLPLIRIRDIFSSETQNSYSGEYKDEFLVSKGDILIGMDGDFKVSKWPGKKGLLNQRVCRILFNSNHYEKEFLFLCIQPYLDAIHIETSAVTVKHLSSRTINDIPFPLPPLVEQKAIVKKIEELFSSLDSGIADLTKAQDQLVIYRQAVLKKAFEGIKEFKPLKDCGEWKGGGTPSRQIKEYWENGEIPWVSSRDVKTKEIHDTERHITEIAIPNSSTKWIEKDSLLFVMRSGILKRIFPIAIAKTKLCVNQDIQTVYLDANWNTEFVYWFLQGNESDIRHSCSKDGTTVESIDANSLKAYLVPFCSLKEQHQIVRVIESRLSVCDKVEKDIADSLKKAQALRQSILKKAFEGKLLSEGEIDKCKVDKDYEPASFLLEKIQKEKNKK
ncbi:restriction endonuclease subunit S [Winogradskyella forsetii]|uniref:restriction endonuclease subunit S n=1 Tax=Winogradskyella forsetii TaxID=2686077 RepID=UPI0015C082AC|nr:restriction endonuclease subunit S [Winogradskyella forsetii]